jgi:miniconductance mechanosensitive channel
LQLVKLVSAVLAAILILATLMDRSPLIFLSGLGAMAAVILLVFRDTLLSVVASIQLTSYNMVHVGDWIEMPEFGADGDVIDVALHTVKVQNWDKTITTIPTHRLVEGSFKNWRGMSNSGGRRIKRVILVDVNTIRFLDDEEVERIGKFALLHDYIAEKKRAIDEYNRDPGRDPSLNTDIRRLTNVGTFRAYIESYLRAHPRIHNGMTLMVRQLAPTPEGLPLEVYCFTNTTDWGAYEGIQADILDHVFAVVSEFGLRCFQAPAGRDLEALAGGEAVRQQER